MENKDMDKIVKKIMHVCNHLQLDESDDNKESDEDDDIYSQGV